MESYEDSVKLCEDYIISESDILISMMKMYKNSGLKINYDLLLKQEAQLIKKICDGKTTFIRVFAVYYFLLWNGFFSDNNYFEFNKHSVSCDMHMPGLSIVVGSGVCFNIVSHFRDLLKYVTEDYSGYVVAFHVDKGHQWNSQHPKIKKNSCIFSNPDRSETDLLNHANLLVIYNDDFYVLDPTNFLIYDVLESDEENLPLTRIELRTHINLNSSYDDVTKLKCVVNELKDLNEILANREYIRCNVATLSKVLNTGVDLCCNHMKDILEFRKKYDYVYKVIALSMVQFSEQVKTRLRRKY